MKMTACPHCGSRKIVANITVRWNHARGVYLPERGSFCTGCGRAFKEIFRGDWTFRSVTVSGITPALRTLQESGDLVVVRHRNGLTEVLF